LDDRLTLADITAVARLATFKQHFCTAGRPLLDPSAVVPFCSQKAGPCPKGDIRPRIPPEAWPCFPQAHQPLAVSLSLAELFVSFELFYLPITGAWGKLAPD